MRRVKLVCLSRPFLPVYHFLAAIVIGAIAVVVLFHLGQGIEVRPLLHQYVGRALVLFEMAIEHAIYY